VLSDVEVFPDVREAFFGAGGGFLEDDAGTGAGEDVSMAIDVDVSGVEEVS